MLSARILIVEDDPDAGHSLAGWLRQKGAEVYHVGDATTADAILAERDFDVIVSDIHLPGNESLLWVERTTRQRPEIPIILLTGRPELGLAIKAANLRVAAFLVKPPDFAQLGDLISRLHAGAQQRQRLQLALGELRAALTRDDAGGPDGFAQLVLKLQVLLPTLDDDTQPSPLTPRPAELRAALSDAVGVIERTKHSFRSRELGQLRQRLMRLLETS